MENQSIILQQQLTNNFWFSFLKSLLLVFLSQCSQSNFIQILVHNLKSNSKVVFSSTLLSLFLIHSISVLIGCSISFFLQSNTVELISIFLLFLTGLIVIIEALIKSSKSLEDEMIVKLKEEIKKTIDKEQQLLKQQQQQQANELNKNGSNNKMFIKQLTIIDECQTEETKVNDSLIEPLLIGYNNITNSKLHKNLNGKERDQYEKKFYSRKQSREWSFKEIIDIIITVICNEIGKPTQMAIIVIAAACNVNGLIFGASLSLFLVTGLACCFGETIAKYFTSRTIMFISGFSFIALGVEVILSR